MIDKECLPTSLLEGSAQPCGCDPGCKPVPHVCDEHSKSFAQGFYDIASPMAKNVAQLGKVLGGVPLIEAHTAKIEGIHDSGLRQKYSSGAMRDPAIGKIDWTRITYGPMMRRWAQHLTTAEAKYPDAALGVPNFMLIETEEELWRYKKSAFRHFMSWFFNETDEDHASATFFNINGVEIIKEKQKNGVAAEPGPV